MPFDCHLHVEKGLEAYPFKDLKANVIFNSLESYQKHHSQYPQFYHSLIFDFKNEWEEVKAIAQSGQLRAFKIHSRIQQLTEDDLEALVSAYQGVSRPIPIIYDAFYYGSALEHQPSLSFIIKLHNALPKTRFIIAHAGGYELLKYFFHLRGLNRVGFDLSFSLQYLHDSSVAADFKKLLRFIPPSRLFWGSDFPSADPQLQWSVLQNFFNELNLSCQARKQICFSSWERFTSLKSDGSYLFPVE
jgi:predicted TIM-barrel fold metal-dependent hydrolase